MNGRPAPLLTTLALVLTLTASAGAQAAQSAGTQPSGTQTAGTLTIAGGSEQVPLVRINGKSYVEIESLARITHGSLRFQGSQTILTLPAAAGTAAPTGATAPVPQLSGGFLNAELEALTQIREWRASLASAVQNNYPVADSWVSGLRRSADAKLQLAIAAATTGADQKAVELLRNEFANMQAMSDQYLAMHAQANYTAPDSFDNNPLDQKILACARAIAAMAATKQFEDEISCH